MTNVINDMAPNDIEPSATATFTVEDHHGQTDDDKSSNNSGNNSSSNAVALRPQLASIRQVFSFGKAQTKGFLCVGFIFAAISGAVGPIMVFYFAKMYSKMSGDSTTDEFMDNVKELAYTFLVLGYV